MFVSGSEFKNQMVVYWSIAQKSDLTLRINLKINAISHVGVVLALIVRQFSQLHPIFLLRLRTQPCT